MKNDAPWPYVAEAGPGNTLGISFSGGGIRSAAFCLGAYQLLSKKGIFGRASYVSGVSGGSYIAGALTVSQGASETESLLGELPPWARGSPEEKYLRSHLSYLAPGVHGRLWLALNFVYGFVLNLVPLLTGAYIAGRLTGLVYSFAFPGIGHDLHRVAAATVVPLGISFALAVLAVGLVGVRRFFDKNRFARMLGERGLRRSAVALAGTAVGMVSLGVLLPLVVHLLSEFLQVIPFWLGQQNDLTFRRLFAAALMVGAALAFGVVAVLLMQRGRARFLQGAFAFFGGWGVVAIPFLLATEGESRRGWVFPLDVWAIVGGLVVLVFFGLFVHNRRYSMHLYYRERLSRAFVLQRQATEGGIDVSPIPYDEQVRLSELGREIDKKRAAGIPFPELVICAAVAARDGDVPSRSWAASFTFDAQRSGSRSLGLGISTQTLEKGQYQGDSDLTLPAMMAISGAAISPNMGRFTLPSFRFLMVLLNLRLGVWIPNPFRSGGGTGAPAARPEREGFWRRLWAGWWEPGALYAIREGTGLADTRGRFIHVSDGGHWENLGLVELVRRRCTHIVVVDASAGGRSPLQDIGRAAALARAELGAEVRLDPSATLPGASSLAESPVAIGSVVYPDGEEALIYYVRCVLWEDAPMDLRVFREIDHQFPSHPTSNQLFSGEQFEAYRALGWQSATVLFEQAHLAVADFESSAVGEQEDDSLVL